jgi:hypothetical protein
VAYNKNYCSTCLERIKKTINSAVRITETLATETNMQGEVWRKKQPLKSTPVAPELAIYTKNILHIPEILRVNNTPLCKEK